MALNTYTLKIKPTTWLVRIKECHHIQSDNSNEVEDPENGLILGDDTGDDQEEDESFEFGVNSVASSKAKKKRLVLQCPKRQLIVETNAFVWPYPIWIIVRIEVHTNVISPPDHAIADSLQKGYFTAVEYFVSDWLSASISGGIGHVDGIALFSQFLSCLRPEMEGNSEGELQHVQAYDQYKNKFCDFL